MRQLLLGVLLFAGAFLGAAPVDVVVSLDVKSLLDHPQFQEVKRNLEKTGEGNTGELYRKYRETLEKIEKGRVTAYIDTSERKWVLVADGNSSDIDRVWEGLRQEAPKDVEDITVDDLPGFTGTLDDGTRMTFLRTSPEQIQSVLEGSFELPFQLAKVNKQLLLAAKGDAVFTVAFVPSKEMMQSNPQMQGMKLVKLLLEGTRPEATLKLVCDFQDAESAQMGKTMVDMMLMMGQQNPNAGQLAVLLGKIKSELDGMSCALSLVLDKETIALLEELKNQMPGVKASPDAEPKTEPEQLPGRTPKRSTR